MMMNKPNFICPHCGGFVSGFSITSDFSVCPYCNKSVSYKIEKKSIQDNNCNINNNRENDSFFTKNSNNDLSKSEKGLFSSSLKSSSFDDYFNYKSSISSDKTNKHTEEYQKQEVDNSVVVNIDRKEQNKTDTKNEGSCEQVNELQEFEISSLTNHNNHQSIQVLEHVANEASNENESCDDEVYSENDRYGDKEECDENNELLYGESETDENTIVQFSKFSHSIDQVMDDFYLSISKVPFIPFDIFNKLSIKNVEQVYMPMYVYEGKTSTAWECEIYESRGEYTKKEGEITEDFKYSGFASKDYQSFFDDLLFNNNYIFSDVNLNTEAISLYKLQEKKEESKNNDEAISYLPPYYTKDEIWIDLKRKVIQIADEKARSVAPVLSKNFASSTSVLLDKNNIKFIYIPLWIIRYSYRDRKESYTYFNCDKGFRSAVDTPIDSSRFEEAKESQEKVKKIKELYKRCMHYIFVLLLIVLLLFFFSFIPTQGGEYIGLYSVYDKVLSCFSNNYLFIVTVILIFVIIYNLIAKIHVKIYQKIYADICEYDETVRKIKYTEFMNSFQDKQEDDEDSW